MEQHTRIRTFLWLLVGAVGIVLADQWLKRVMVNWIGPGAETHRVEMLGRAFAFEYLENRGAAFGMFTQGTQLLAIVSVIAVIVCLVMLWRSIPLGLPLCIGITLIIGGAAGNGIDRIVRGYVVDYIAVGNFWKFNLADSAVVVGAILTFLMLIVVDMRHADTQDTKP